MSPIKIRVLDEKEDLGELIHKQEGRHCVPSSFINGIVRLKNNFITRNTTKEKALKKMNDLVTGLDPSYAGIPPGMLRNLIYGRQDTAMNECTLEIKKQEYQISYYDKSTSIDSLKEMLNNHEGFLIGPSIKTQSHQVCVYDYQENKFQFKDSLGAYKYSMNDTEFNNYLKEALRAHKDELVIVTNKDYKLKINQPKIKVTEIKY